MGRGVEIELGGKPRVLRFGYNEIADLEEEAGCGITELLGNEKRVGLYTLRLLLAYGLRHEERGMTKQRAGMLLDEHLNGGGDMSAFSEKLMEAVMASGVLGNVEPEAAVE